VIRFPADAPARPLRQLSSTEIRIGEKLYYVARLPRTAQPSPVRHPVRKPPAPAPDPAPDSAGTAALHTPARAFIPPEIKRDSLREQTLIQPLSPPDLQPAETALPTFQVWTASVPKIPKPFVAPGARPAPVPDAQPLLAPPTLELTVTNSPAPKSNPALVLPLPAAPLDSDNIAAQTNSQAMLPQGDAVNIVSITPNPAFPGTLVVPPGNIAGITGSHPSPEAALPAKGGGGTAATTAPKNVVIVQPANGTFDAQIVQSSPPRKDLLSGKPVYTVYLSVGTAKEWTFYFCVPETPQPRAEPARIVTLETPAPVAAPYPTRIVRPLISFPEGQQYLLVHGFVTRAGRVERVRVVDSGAPEADQAMLAAVVDWQFRPATRDGQTLAVEFLLAIPRAGL
jgi:TonB family protein